MKLRAPELREEFERQKNNPGALEALASELREHRKTGQAKSLLREVQAVIAGRSNDSGGNPAPGVPTQNPEPARRKKVTPATGRPKKSGRTISGPAGPPTVMSPSRPTGRTCAERDLETRYQLLRATFTSEGEILARWGMTASLPAEMEAAVFQTWRSRLAAGPDEMGRDLMQLAQDLERLSMERDLDDLGRRGGTP